MYIMEMGVMGSVTVAVSITLAFHERGAFEH
jgi:hypothetical protein